MLDQSFSPENLRIILDIENRKGNYLEKSGYFEQGDYFEISRRVSDEIIAHNFIVNNKKKELIRFGDLLYKSEDLEKLFKDKETLKEKRDDILFKILSNISTTISRSEFRLDVKTSGVKYGKQLYAFKSTPENLFASKQIQRNLYKTFKVKQQDRSRILSQLKLLISDEFPKVIVRTDIEKFYESIPHEELFKKIDNNNLLSFQSKFHIKHCLNAYWQILVRDGEKSAVDKKCGIPRGIGFSAYLAELYLKEFDSLMSKTPNIIFYKRYVDDIVAVFVPEHNYELTSKNKYESRVTSLMKKVTSLNANLKKTKTYDLRKKGKMTYQHQLIFLGYKFSFGWIKEGDKIGHRPLIISMSDRKFEKYKEKIELAFQDYKRLKIKYNGKSKGVSQTLTSRIRFLATNFRLLRRKDNVFVGIFFSNEFLSAPYEDLKELDKILSDQINALPSATKSDLVIKKKLNQIIFLKGFTNRTFSKFNQETFKNDKFLKIWKDI